MGTPEQNAELKRFYVRLDAATAKNERLRASGFGYLARWPEYPPGLFGMACGAKTRAGTPCKQKAIFRNGRCKWHGGLATGPKTEAGKEQARINGRKGGRPKKQGKVPVRVREKQPKP